MSSSSDKSSITLLEESNIQLGSLPPLKFKKRKRDRLGEGIISTQNVVKLKKAKLDDEGYLDLEKSLNIAFGTMDSRLLADHVARQTKHFAQDLSLVELEDRHVPERAFLDTSGWAKPRLLKNLPEFLGQYSQSSGQTSNLSFASKKYGAPHTIVITSAGMRAADTIRVLRTFQTKEAAVAKLFAKHIKLKDAIDYVKKTRMGIGVGTSTRIIDLLDAGALSFERLERVVVDCSHIDQKNRGILDMRETHQPLMQLLNRHDLRSRYGISSQRVALLFY